MTTRNYQPGGYTSEGSHSPDNLIAGDQINPITLSVTLVSGQNIVRGTVLGIITSGGKYTTSLSAASNGSQTPKAIAAEDCDASGGDKTTLVYIAGVFNQNELTLGTAHTIASIREGLRDNGIYLKDSVPN
jgi:hypothetical protein